MGILNIVTYIPLIGAVLILLFLPKENGKAIRYTATFVAVADFIASLYLWFNFDPKGTGDGMWQFRFIHSWIPSLNVKYDFGIDGISLLLILLTTFMGIIAVVSSFAAIDHRQKEYYILLLL
ncbi:MAG TPA: Fe-S-binding domain-containing protein, partial [Thermoanaerobaculia bacterium]|nr:Fe-S-binding domain-containing protein [Thermoanaerobaculia bacterium]